MSDVRILEAESAIERDQAPAMIRSIIKTAYSIPVLEIKNNNP